MKSNRKFIETGMKKKTYTTTNDFKSNEFEERQGQKPNVKIVQNELKAETIKSNQKQENNSGNAFEKLPEELSSTFEKIVHQLDLITTTMKVFEKRIATVEEQMVEVIQSSKSERGNKNCLLLFK